MQIVKNKQEAESYQKEIRYFLKSLGYSQRRIAAMFGVDQSTISKQLTKGGSKC